MQLQTMVTEISKVRSAQRLNKYLLTTVKVNTFYKIALAVPIKGAKV